jgi:cholesterol oxidase
VQRDGLLEAHVFPRLLAITSSGVGGGSHVYTNIQAQPEDEYFGEFLPEITASEMRPHYEAVRAMLRPAQAPQLPQRTDAFARAVAAAGLGAVEYPDLAMVFGADGHAPSPVVNAAGVMQRTSTYSGTEILGCQDRSKTTLDLTYLPMALRHGAQIRPLAEVTAIGPGEVGYWIRWRDHLRRVDNVVETPRLVLAAGTLGTLRLLLAARDRDRSLPGLPARLGHGLTPNADMATIVYRSKLIQDGARGPAFGSYTRVRHAERHRYLIGDVGLPLAALPLPGPIRCRLAQSMVLFGMGRDAGGGRAWLESGCLRTDVGRRLDPVLYGEVAAAMAGIAARLGGRRGPA